MKSKFRIINIIFIIVAFQVILVSCQDMLETGSDRIMYEDEHTLSSPNDSIYSLMGILSQFRKIGDRYIIFGELRGDLMNVTENASTSLKEIAAFDASPDNVYLNKYDYYNIINNCNYVIAKMDTAITIRQQKALLPEFVAIKTIRAWTYWQMAQVFGSVSYIEKPILNLEASLTDYPRIGMDELAGKLIQDLYPFQSVRKIDYGSLESKPTTEMTIPVQILLGDLYLYQNRYEDAASMYYQVIYDNGYIISPSYTNRYLDIAGEYCSNSHFRAYIQEVVSEMVFSNQLKYLTSDLANITYSDKAALMPAKSFVEDMASRLYLYAESPDKTAVAFFDGDTRGCIKINKQKEEIGDAFQSLNLGTDGTVQLITKYFNNATLSGNRPESWNNELLSRPSFMREIPIYRQPHLYLRYAEAINRANKPSFAFAVLKTGLNKINIANPHMVNQEETKDMKPYMNFSDARFDNNIGTAVRGRGYGIVKDQTEFVIPPLPTLQDSVQWVELRILEEMSAETSFEGNRFFDLLRVSRRRDNHPAFMAEMVARKFENTALKEKLKADINAWFFK